MSYRGYNSGCGLKLVFVLIIISIILLIVDGIGSCENTSHSTKSTNYNTTKTKKGFEIGQQVDPVYRTSTGEIVEVPNAPDYYYDIRTTCKSCNGTGRKKQWDGEKIVEVWCPICRRSGFGIRPLSEMPKGKVPYEKLD